MTITTPLCHVVFICGWTVDTFTVEVHFFAAIKALYITPAGTTDLVEVAARSGDAFD